MIEVDKSIKNSLIADSISNWTWELDFSTSEVTFSEEWISFLGYTKEEFKQNNDNWFSLIYEEDLNKIKNSIVEIIEGNTDYYNAEFRVRTKNNGYKWILSKGKTLRDPSGKVIYIAGIYQDITAYKNLEESENKYRTLFDNVNDMILLSTVNKDGTVGKFIEVNDMACKILGYSRDEILNMSGEDINSNEDSQDLPFKIKENMDKSINKKIKDNRQTTEIYLIKKDKTILPTEISSHFFKLNGESVKLDVVRDISERVKSNEVLKEITERNKKIVELSPHGILIQNKGILTFINEAGVKMLKANSKEELIGRHLFTFIESNNRGVMNARQNLLEDGVEVDTIELQVICMDGSQIICEVVSTPMPSKEGPLALSYIKDITFEKFMAEENNRLLEQTVEYDRLKTEFFSNISHELRTPLNIILSSIQLLTMLYESSKGDCSKMVSSFERYMAVMKQNGYRLLRLINNLIDITRLDSGFLNLNLSNHNIVEVIENITLSVAPYIESKGIMIIFDTEFEEKLIACDEDKIERIILNLISNAVKYTKESGTIEVNIKEIENKLRISIKDTGCGIPKDMLNVIFERFRQVDSILTRRSEGSGIGLSLVKALVEAHGGVIWVDSELEKGSEFIVELPIKVLEACEVNTNLSNDQSLDGSKVQRISIEFSDI